MVSYSTGDGYANDWQLMDDTIVFTLRMVNMFKHIDIVWYIFNRRWMGCNHEGRRFFQNIRNSFEWNWSVWVLPKEDLLRDQFSADGVRVGSDVHRFCVLQTSHGMPREEESFGHRHKHGQRPSKCVRGTQFQPMSECSLLILVYVHCHWGKLLILKQILLFKPDFNNNMFTCHRW